MEGYQISYLRLSNDGIGANLKQAFVDKNITLCPNNTLKCKLRCSLNVDFWRLTHSVGRMLGFTENKLLETYKTHWSEAPGTIIKVNTIKIRCNKVQGSYQIGETNTHFTRSTRQWKPTSR